MYALRERRVHVTQEDFELAVAKVSPGVWNTNSAPGGVVTEHIKTQESKMVDGWHWPCTFQLYSQGNTHSDCTAVQNEHVTQVVFSG